MREILFRGKRIDNGEWVDGRLAAYDLICPNYPEDTSNAMGDYYGQTPYVGFVEVDAETVGQFTGLTDKNGKRIFEGDICKVGNLIYKVVFEYSCWWFNILSNKVYCCPAFHSHCGEYCEIIGNIHDNPELLEVKNAEE